MVPSDTRVQDLASQILILLGNWKVVTVKNSEQIQDYLNRTNLDQRRWENQASGLNTYRPYQEPIQDYSDRTVSSISLLHNSLYKYFHNIVSFFWKSPLFTKPTVSSKSLKVIEVIDPSNLRLVQERLLNILSLKSKISGDAPRRKERNQMFGGSSQTRDREQRGPLADPKVQAFVAAVCRLLNHGLEAPRLLNEELSDEELDSRRSFFVMVERTLQVVYLFEALCKFKPLLMTLNDPEVDQLCTLTFSELVLNNLAGDLINKLLLVLAVKASDDASYQLQNNLHSVCKDFYSVNDANFAVTYRK